jgi:hypothetical protein
MKNPPFGQPNPDEETAEGTPGQVDSPMEESDEGEASFGEAPNVSPEEQQSYDIVVKAALHQIWTDDQSHRVIVDKLKASGDNIAAGIGHTAAMMLLSLSRGAQEQGRMVPDEVLIPAGQEICAELLELSIALGLVQPSESDDTYKKAVLEGVKVYGTAQLQEGKISAEDMDGASQELKQMMPAQQAPQQPPAAPPGIVQAAQGA